MSKQEWVLEGAFSTKSRRQQVYAELLKLHGYKNVKKVDSKRLSAFGYSMPFLIKVRRRK